MKTIRNIVIGTMMAMLMLTVLAAPAAAEVDAMLYVYPELGSVGYVMDEDGVTKLHFDHFTNPHYYGDLIQLIEPGPDGVIDPPDYTDPKYIGGDDEYNWYTDQNPPYPLHVIGENVDEAGLFYIWAWEDMESTIDWYIRAWNADTIENATHYGDSIIVTATGVGVNEYDMLPSGTWWTNIPKPGPAEESKLVDMSVGWNAIALCFEPSSNATADVLSSISGKYDAVKEWDASLDTWADASTMDRGTGYFVHVPTTPCTWTHTGTNVTDEMTIPLETDLNFVGYPFNKVNTTSDALAGLDYYYAAPFDASTQKYEDTYNPAAPAPFNDFTTINPCVGFWISSNDGGDWTVS